MESLKHKAAQAWGELASHEEIQHVEAGLLLMLIAAAAVAVATTLDTDVRSVFTQVGTTMCAGAISAC